MNKQMTPFDLKIRKRVRMKEEKIPPDIEASCLEKLNLLSETISDKEEPKLPWMRRSRQYFYLGTVAAAATVLLVIMMILFYLFYQQNSPHVTPTADADEVWLQDAMVDGKQAKTFVISPTDQDITIFWVEKINTDDKPLKINNSNKGEFE